MGWPLMSAVHLGALAALSLSQACHHARPVAACAATSQLNVRAETGRDVRVTWSPVCSVGRIRFETADGDTRRVVWFVSSNANAIAPGLIYGSATPGMLADDARPLEFGRSYRVQVGVVIGGDQIIILGETSFTR
jgi:hypothetical protein